MFHFKRFSMHNSRSGLKVGTDGVLLGAWCQPSADASCIWDVGCGSGLIALMLAQKCQASIYGVEVNGEAFDETVENFAISPWSDRLKAVRGDIAEVAPTLPRPDVIVCNPPYYELGKSIQAAGDKRDCARREGTLSFESVISLASEVLTDRGELWLVAPAQRLDDIMWCLELAKLNPRRVLRVCTVARKAPSRVLVMASRIDGPLEEKAISIHDSTGDYTAEYKALTSDYYLNF